jgi:hypothetical protein
MVGHRLFATQVLEMATRSALWSDNATVQRIEPRCMLDTTSTFNWTCLSTPT